MDKEKLNKELLDILYKFGAICGGIMFGEIPFTFNGDALMCALKPGHPGDIMDDIVSMVYAKVNDDPFESLPTVKEGLSSFKAFKKVFGIVSMKEPIEELSAYVKKVEAAKRAASKRITRPRKNKGSRKQEGQSDETR